MKRKICVITGSRAEYGILKPLIRKIVDDKDLMLQLIVTGMHLSPEFGSTYKEIEKDGFEIVEKIEILLSSDTSVGVSKSMGLTMISFSEAYMRLSPDIVVGVGDRFELVSAAIVAHTMRIPVAHIGGGEITEGAIDDAFRHAITKMSQLHFVSTKEYEKRVIQLGESPGSIFCVGELSLDASERGALLTREELEDDLNIKFNKRNLLVTFHPNTIENDLSCKEFQALLEVLDQQFETTVIFTKSNADTEGRVLNQMVDNYVSKHRQTSYCFYSLGSSRYLSLLQYMDAVVGNSSSGIVEAPAFKIGTINVGDRQKGRIRAKSIIDCKATKHDITKAFKELYSNEFKKNLNAIKVSYGKVNTAIDIKKILKKVKLQTILKKTFFDL